MRVCRVPRTLTGHDDFVLSICIFVYNIFIYNMTGDRGPRSGPGTLRGLSGSPGSLPIGARRRTSGRRSKTRRAGSSKQGPNTTGLLGTVQNPFQTFGKHFSAQKSLRNLLPFWLKWLGSGGRATPITSQIKGDHSELSSLFLMVAFVPRWGERAQQRSIRR